MADSKTVFRELSVLYGLHKLFDHTSPGDNYEDFYKKVELYASQSQAFAALNENPNQITLNSQTITNGLAIAQALITVFSLKRVPEMKWVGENIHGATPIDIYVNHFGISLKENSFILENMGLYNMVNTLTGSSYSRGSLHIFKKFSPAEYQLWFKTTWALLLDHLQTENNLLLTSPNSPQVSQIRLTANHQIILKYDNLKLASAVELPIDVNLDQFEQLTSSLIREKVFAKWINTYISHNHNYIAVKKKCAQTAGQNLARMLRQAGAEAQLARLFRIHEKPYYYAKATNKTVEIYKIPSLNSFVNNFKISRLESSVPESQLNFLTEVTNTATHESLTFRNEIRFSHGQFNGTPEAKLYLETGSPLKTIYQKIYSHHCLPVGNEQF